MTRFHTCPGRCGTQVPHHHLACRPCWFRLPQPMRDTIKSTSGYRRSKAAHRRALQDAIQWYQANPLPERNANGQS